MFSAGGGVGVGVVSSFLGFEPIVLTSSKISQSTPSRVFFNPILSISFIFFSLKFLGD
jgi:hypothetical protein